MRSNARWSGGIIGLHDSPLEGTGFEPLVPRKPVILTRPFVEVDHLLPWAEAEPGQECRGKQRRMQACGAIDLQEIARPEILDPSQVERHHPCTDVLCLFERNSTERA